MSKTIDYGKTTILRKKITILRKKITMGMNIEEKAKRYDEAIEKAKDYYHLGDSKHKMAIDAKAVMEYIFPELAESEDEKIRKAIIGFLKEEEAKADITSKRSKTLCKYIAWLEKQGEQKSECSKENNMFSVEQAKVLDKHIDDMINQKQDEPKADCPRNHQDVNHPNGCIVMEDFNGGEGFYKVNLDYLNKKQVEEIEEMVMVWNKEISTQKPADKVEPKFYKGEWLCENEPNNYARFIQILETVNVQGKERYRISRDIHNDEDIVEFDFVEKYYHKFDIQDAKEGDVLKEDSCTFIIQKLGDNGTAAKTYCTLYDDGDFDDGSILYFDVDSTKPATKEQRDLLFHKMEEAGYIWDADKKKLVKDEIMIKAGRNYRCTKTHIYAGLDWLEGTKYYADEDYSLVNNGCTCFCPKYSKYEHNNLFEEVECDSCIEKQCEHNPAWSEEDEKILNLIIQDYEAASKSFCGHKGKLDWLKSFKERVQPQQKQEWSEDESMWAEISDLLWEGYKQSGSKFSWNDIRNWVNPKLKSLRPQNRWKPSEEQMKQLHKYCIDNKPLNDLYEQLKAL